MRCCATRRAGMFADPSKVRAVRHEGSYYRMEGIHLSEPSPQRTPLLFQAGASARGQDFAAQTCRMRVHRQRHAAGRQADRRSACARRPKNSAGGADALRILNLMTVVVGRTEKEAQDKLEDYRRHASVEASLAHYSSSIGIDLSKYGLDEPIEQKTTNANQSALAAAITRAGGKAA